VRGEPPARYGRGRLRRYPPQVCLDLLACRRRQKQGPDVPRVTDLLAQNFFHRLQNGVPDTPAVVVDDRLKVRDVG